MKEWKKVNEAHELFKMQDEKDGKLLQHLHPSLLLEQYDRYLQDRQRKAIEDKKRSDEQEKQKA
jgi:hypothetical protein